MHNPQIPRQNAIVLERKRHAVQKREKSEHVKNRKKKKEREQSSWKMGHHHRRRYHLLGQKAS